MGESGQSFSRRRGGVHAGAAHTHPTTHTTGRQQSRRGSSKTLHRRIRPHLDPSTSGSRCRHRHRARQGRRERINTLSEHNLPARILLHITRRHGLAGRTALHNADRQRHSPEPPDRALSLRDRADERGGGERGRIGDAGGAGAGCDGAIGGYDGDDGAGEAAFSRVRGECDGGGYGGGVGEDCDGGAAEGGGYRGGGAEEGDWGVARGGGGGEGQGERMNGRRVGLWE